MVRTIHSASISEPKWHILRQDCCLEAIRCTAQHPIEQLPQSRAKKLLAIVTSYYAIALIVAAGCAALFGWLAEEVLEQEFTTLNTSILLAIHSYQNSHVRSSRIYYHGSRLVLWRCAIGGLLVLSLLLMKRMSISATSLAVLIGCTVHRAYVQSSLSSDTPTGVRPACPGNELQFSQRPFVDII